jgi:glycosyltransferase involved in cell wall biosynthesis
VVIHNGIDHSKIPGPFPRQKLILFAGRMTPEKGADAFVAACARVLPRLPGWRAEMIGADSLGAGSRETDFLTALRPRASAAGIGLLGYLPHEAVLEAMARAAIVVVPSRWEEPFGLTALEAMGCGAALECSMRGGLAELAGGACLQIDPDRVDEMAERLFRLAQDPAERARLGAAGRARSAWFDATRAAGAYDRLRRAVLFGP